jgi:hypothetical protein
MTSGFQRFSKSSFQNGSISRPAAAVGCKAFVMCEMTIWSR